MPSLPAFPENNFYSGVAPAPNHLFEILQNIPGVIYELRQHPDGHFSLPYASEKLWEIYGVTAIAVREDARPIFAAIHPEDRLTVQKTLQKSAENLTPWRSHHRVCRPDGCCVWVITHATPKRQTDGGTKWYGQAQTTTHLADIQQRSENKLRRIIENLNDMVFIITPNGRFSFVSPMVITIMGYSLSELTSQPFTQFVHPQDLHICVNGFQACLAGQKVQGLEYRVLHKDGNYYWHSANLSGFKEEENSAYHCLGVSSYIHDRKQAELRLEESKIQLQLALESSNTGLWDWYLPTNEVIFNKQWKSMLGYEEHEIEHNVKQWEILVHPEDIQKACHDLQQHIQGKTSIYKNEHRLRCKNGTYKWILDQGRIVEWDQEGKPIRFIGTHTDISEIKQAELALIELTNQSKKAQEIAHLGYWSLDLTTQKITWSEEVFRIFNRPPEQGEPTLAELIQQIHPEDFDYWSEKVAAATQGNPQKFDFRILWADGTVRYLSNWIEIEYQGEQVVRQFGVVMDITERKIAELEYQASLVKRQELEAAYQKLQQAQMQLIQAEKMSSLGQLVAGIAHEINNPVNFIYGNLEFVSQYANSLLAVIQAYQATYPQPTAEIKKLSEELELDFVIEDLPHTIKSMQTGALRIQNIVKSLRIFSRLDESEIKAVDIHENIDSTLVILENHLNISEKNQKINVIKNYDKLPKFECYIGLLNQVFMNLIMNGIQAIKEQYKRKKESYQGLITITTKAEDSGAVSISIEDNGIGMTDAVKAKIFEPFFTTKPVGSGTGMGLPISHQIITKYHQGEFYVNSKLGEGTIFTMRLPKLKRNG